MKWWGYVHVNGTIQVKRYFDKQDLEEAHESPFCGQVSEVVEADDREHAALLVTLDLGED